MNLAEILKLKFPLADFTTDIQLGQNNDGSISIRVWNIEDQSMPSQDDLDIWAKDLDLQYRQNLAREAREYPPIGDQLDMIYHDKINNTNIWLNTITNIKSNNPKPVS